MREQLSGRPDRTPALQTWPSAKANAASHGGRWLCMDCCRYQRGPKASHKAECTPDKRGKKP